jgi:hypothetical protein
MNFFSTVPEFKDKRKHISSNAYLFVNMMTDYFQMKRNESLVSPVPAGVDPAPPARSLPGGEGMGRSFPGVPDPAFS